MKRVILGFLHALVLMLSVMYSPVFAQQAPSNVQKEPDVAGKIEIPVNGWRAEFSLETEPTATTDQYFVLWSEEVGRQMQFSVKEVIVRDDGTVRWRAQCIFDSLGGSHVGRWLVVELQPATQDNPEMIGWDWSSGYQEEKAQEMLLDEDALPFLWQVQEGAVAIAAAARN